MIKKIIKKKIVIIKKDCNNWKRLWWLKRIVMIEKDCDDWKKLWWLKKIVVKEIYACNKMLVNEVIKAVLNSLFYFFTKRFRTHQKHQKHQKHKDATKQKHKNSNKRISDFFPHRCFLSSFFIFVHCKWFVLCACGIFQ